MDNKLRQDEDALLEQLTKHNGWKVVQKIALEITNRNVNNMIEYETPSETRLLRLGEISGVRKLLAVVVSRSENAVKTPSWTEHKGVPAWQTNSA